MDHEHYPTSPLQQFAIAINFFFPSLAMVVLGLRLYSKASHKSFGPGTFRHPSTLLGPDDMFACFSMIFSIGLTVGSYFYIKTNYVGIEPEDIPPHDIRRGFVWTFVVQVLYFPVLALIKSSVLFFLLRLGVQKPGIRLTIYALNALTLAMMVAVFIVSVAQCRPVPYYWDRSIPDGSCINQPVFYLHQAGLNILTDLFTLGVPVWIFFHMKMERRMKIITLYVFLLGFIVTLIGIIRFVFLYMLFYYDIRAMENYTMSFCLSSVETNLAIVCACAPTLRGLLRSWFPRALVTPDEYTTAETKSPSTGAKDSIRQSNRASFPGDDVFGYPKDGRGRVLCSHAEVEGLGLTPSEEDVMRSNGILRTTDVVVKHGDERSLTRADTADGDRDRSRSGSRSRSRGSDSEGSR